MTTKGTIGSHVPKPRQIIPLTTKMEADDRTRWPRHFRAEKATALIQRKMSSIIL